jgi:Tfp pilus assembly protein FimT
LIELVGVVFIIGVIAAVGVPRYSSAAARYQLGAAARLLAAQLNLQRQAAMVRTDPQSVFFDVANNRYTLFNLRDMDSAASLTVVNLDDEAVTLVSGIGAVVTGANKTLTYDEYGVPSHSGDVVLSAGSRNVTISVDADSGKAVLQ